MESNLTLRTRVSDLFGIDYPIVQGGMIWASSASLAGAVSEGGGLGLLGAGSMGHEELRQNIQEVRTITKKPFGVNVPLMRPDVEDLINVVKEEKVKIVFTSAGNPAQWASYLKDAGHIVVHVVPSVKHARKAESCGVDAIAAEGFEAGGHNSPMEISTMVLIPQVVDAVNIPVIAAGGIADSRGLVAAMALGAEGVQLGTRFAATVESCAHDNFKKAIVEAGDASTVITGRTLREPVRCLANEFTDRIIKAETEGTPPDELRNLIGFQRSKMAIVDGDQKEGGAECGQIAGIIGEILPAGEAIRCLMADYRSIIDSLPNME